MISCKEVMQLVSQRQDRALGLGERVALRAHVAFCAGCRNVEKQLAFLRRAVARLSEHGGVRER